MQGADIRTAHSGWEFNIVGLRPLDGRSLIDTLKNYIDCSPNRFIFVEAEKNTPLEFKGI